MSLKTEDEQQVLEPHVHDQRERVRPSPPGSPPDLEPQVRPLKVGTAETGGSEDRVPIRWREGVYPKQKGDKESGPRPTPHMGPSRPHRGRPGAQPCRPSKEAAGEDSSPSD